MGVNFNIPTGIKWGVYKPDHPLIGDTYMDFDTYTTHTWTGTAWVEMTSNKKMIPEDAVMNPTQEQLDKHPSLKQAWNEYIVIKKILGL